MKNIQNKQRSTNKTAEQIFSLALLAGTLGLLFCCLILRLYNVDWFLASFDKIPELPKFWQDRVMNVLFVFEMTFVFKILTRKRWMFCLIISIIQTVTIEFIPEELYANIFNLCIVLFVPVICTRKLSAIIDSIFLYAMMILYSIIFLVGRVGNLDTSGAYSFEYSIIGILDYKLFIIVIYFYIKHFGGIRLWKTQKRLLLQKDLKKVQEE